MNSISVDLPPGRYKVKRKCDEGRRCTAPCNADHFWWVVIIRADRSLYLANIDGAVPNGQDIDDETAIREFGDPENWRKL